MQIVEASRDIATLEKMVPLYIESAATQAESSLAARRKALRKVAAVSPGRLEAVPCSVLRPQSPLDGVALFPVPYALELWIAHLGWLDRLAAGVQFNLDDLTAEEARGLALLRQEREKFWQAHRSCPQCQSVNVRGASFCGTCGAEFG